MKIQLNNMPKLHLSQLLKRRKMTLKQMLDELGITTYAGLSNTCDRMGVLPPVEDEFNKVLPPRLVSDPAEGVVIIEPMKITKESDGTVIPDEELAPFNEGDMTFADPPWDDDVSGSMPTEASQKKRRNRKVGNLG